MACRSAKHDSYCSHIPSGMHNIQAPSIDKWTVGFHRQPCRLFLFPSYLPPAQKFNWLNVLYSAYWPAQLHKFHCFLANIFTHSSIDPWIGLEDWCSCLLNIVLLGFHLKQVHRLNSLGEDVFFFSEDINGCSNSLNSCLEVVWHDGHLQRPRSITAMWPPQ